MKVYDSHRNSNFDWFDKIPSNWNIASLNHLVTFIMGQAPHSDSYNTDGIGEIFVKTGDFGILRPTAKWHTTTPLVFASEKDVFMCVVGATSGKVNLGIDGTISRSIAALRPNRNISQKFLYYFLSCNYQMLNDSAQGSAQGIINKTILSNVKMPIPSIEEQTKIAAFLDYKTNLIDATIEKKKHLIDLLKEKRQAVINEAVTKGLNPNAPMKDSGVEWLGEIPEDWSVVKLKHIVDMRSGNFISAEIIEEVGAYPVYGGNGLRGFTSQCTHEGYFPLIGRQGALCGNINYASGQFWATEHAVVVSSKREINTYWIGELLRVMNLNQYSQASAQPGLSVEKILNLRIPFPTFEEQNLIANKIEALNSKIELSLLHLKSSFEKLQTYRQSLILEAVTGKIDVRDWQPSKK